LLLLLHLKLGCTHFQECLQCSLFGRKGGTWFCGGLFCGCVEDFGGGLHIGPCTFGESGDLWCLGGFFECLLELFHGLSLRLGDRCGVLG
jgi:hypothetical protein